VIKAVPKDQLVAIYIKGSFVRREMKSGSDVDMVPIVLSDQYQADVFGVNGPDLYPVCTVPLSIGELEDNKLHTKFDMPVDLRAKPDRMLKMLEECRLVYGKPLNPLEFPIRSNEDVYRDEVEVIKNGYIPYFEAEKIDFDPLLKEFFWLVEGELELKGIKPRHSFAEITKSVKDPNHLIHEAWNLKQQRTKKDELKFVAKLRAYLIDSRAKS